MNEIKPITPDEVIQNPTAHPQMVEVVNELLRKHFDGSQAILRQDEIKDAFLKRAPEYDSQRMYAEKLMDIEQFYRNAGWKVIYDKPGFNETHYPPTFTFTPKKS